MGRFEKITKIDGYEVTFVTSYNNMEVYRETGDSTTLWLVVDEQVIFGFCEGFGEMCVTEEYKNL